MKALLKNNYYDLTAVKAQDVKPDKPVSFFEFWPGWLFYAPVAVYCLWLSVRYGGLTVPTAANPSIRNGGVVGESKSEILNLIPSRHIAAFEVIKADNEAYQRAKEAMLDKGFSYPIVCKPDNGCRGAGVQLVKGDRALRCYIADFPKGQKFLVQELAGYENEVGVFYVKEPGEAKGRVLSLTIKYFPYVIGDGRSTIKDLVMEDDRASKIPDLYLSKLGRRQNDILAKGERFKLVFSGTHSKGAIFKDGAELITPELESRFDEIARQIDGFYFGRFDVRFKSLSDLEAGHNFKIIELNGATGEMTHIWDSKTTLRKAYKDMFYQYKLLFQIGKKNIRRGIKPVLWSALWADYKLYKTLSKSYPETH